MADLVSYYVKSTPTHGPAALYRRRPDEEYGSRVDEYLVPRRLVPKHGEWRENDGLRKYEAGRADWDFYGVHPDEAERVREWLWKVGDVGRDQAGLPPVLGEWGVGHAWRVRLKGPLPEQTVATIIDRLGMTRRAERIDDWRERDIALRVLRSDQEARWNLELQRVSDERWYLELSYLRLTPDEQIIQELRDQVFTLAAELGLEIDAEQVATQESYPYSERARAQGRPDADWVLAMWFRGALTEDTLRTLAQRIRLEAAAGGDLDGPVFESGTEPLPDGSWFQLRLRRTEENRWRFEVGTEGERPPDEVIDGWHEQIAAAASEAGLRFEQDWLRPRPATEVRPPARVLFRVALDGQFTAETLDGFRDDLGIGKRGRIDDETARFYGERVLRNEENRLVRLVLTRTFVGGWLLSLSYQDTPPDRAIVDQLSRNITAAAQRAGLTVSRESHNPAGGGNS